MDYDHVTLRAIEPMIATELKWAIKMVQQVSAYCDGEIIIIGVLADYYHQYNEVVSITLFFIYDTCKSTAAKCSVDGNCAIGCYVTIEDKETDKEHKITTHFTEVAINLLSRITYDRLS